MRRLASAILATAVTAGAASAQTGGWLRDGSVAFSLGTAPGFALPNTPTPAVIPPASFSTNSVATGNQVLGGTDHVFNHWWWFRQAGDPREFAFNSSGGGATSNGFFNANAAVAGNVATINQTYPSFDASLAYVVNQTGFNAGFVRMTMTLTNNTNSPLVLDLFNVIDADVGGTSGADSAFLANTNVIRINDANSPWVAEFTGSGASAYQVAPFGVGSVSSLMTNGVVDNLNNTGLPFGPGDITIGYQWRITIDPGFSRSITSTFSVIPAPGAGAVLALAGLAAARRRRA